ncbi:hypothetical protein L9F63_002739, partial [Diploptera punctata]
VKDDIVFLTGKLHGAAIIEGRVRDVPSPGCYEKLSNNQVHERNIQDTGINTIIIKRAAETKFVSVTRPGRDGRQSVRASPWRNPAQQSVRILVLLKFYFIQRHQFLSFRHS